MEHKCPTCGSRKRGSLRSSRSSSEASFRSNRSGRARNGVGSRKSSSISSRSSAVEGIAPFPIDQIGGFSRKPDGGYWKDREHADRQRRPASAPDERMSASNLPLHPQRYADPMIPGPGYIRKFDGGYYKRKESMWDGARKSQPEPDRKAGVDPTLASRNYRRRYDGAFYTSARDINGMETPPTDRPGAHIFRSVPLLAATLRTAPPTEGYTGNQNAFATGGTENDIGRTCR